MQKLTDKQKKATVVIVTALLFVHFLPNIIGSLRGVFVNHAPAPVAQPKITAPVQSAARPVTVTPPLPDPLTAQLIGIFQGEQMMEDASVCHMKIEVRPDVAKVGSYQGFEEMSCIPSAIFGRGGLTASRGAQLPNIITQASPVRTSMSGNVVNGAMAFHVEQVFGATPVHCGPTSYSISNFGSNQVMAVWEASPCPGGHMILLRSRS